MIIKSKKRLYQSLAVIVGIIILFVGVILAYLTDTDEKNNKLIIGNVDIILHEYSWNPTDYSSGDTSGEPDAVVVGFGETVPKDPQVENVGRTPAYIYVRVDVPRGSYQDGLTTVRNQNLIEYEIDTENWTELTAARSIDETGDFNVYYYYYNDILPAPSLGGTSITPTLFNSITLKSNAVNIESEILDVNVKAYAIQATGLPQGTTVDTTEWAKEFIAGAMNQDISECYKIAVGDGSLDTYYIELKENEKVKIDLQKPENVQGDFEEYTFSSADSNIVTVTNNGLITAIENGETTITITGSISGTTKNINVTVIGPIPIADCEVSVDNETMQNEEQQAIIIKKPINREGDIEPVTCVSSDNNVVTVTSKGLMTAVGRGTATITISGTKSGTSKTVVITVKSAGGKLITLSELASSELGDYVDLETGIFENLQAMQLADGKAILADWRVFDKEENGAWLILSSYLPITKFPSNIGIKQKVSPYSVTYSSNRTGMLNGLSNTTAWKEIISANNNLYANENVIVKGTPTIQEWLESWHSNAGYVHVNVAMRENYGYYVYKDGESASSNKTSLSSNNGYNDTLYFPYKTNLSSCNGYFLNSPNANSTSAICGVNSSGQIAYNYANNNGYLGLRPIVYIPYGIE